MKFLTLAAAALLAAAPAQASEITCRIRFLPGNSAGQPAGRVVTAHGRNDEPNVQFFLTSDRGGIAWFKDVSVMDDSCRFLPQKWLD